MKENVGWRHGSAIKSTHCSCRGPRFDPQLSHYDSQPSLTPTPGHLTLSDSMGTRHIDMHVGKTLIHIKEP